MGGQHRPGGVSAGPGRQRSIGYRDPKRWKRVSIDSQKEKEKKKKKGLGEFGGLGDFQEEKCCRSAQRRERPIRDDTL